MNMLAESLRPATDRAIDKALHKQDPDRIHLRVPAGMPCPLCPIELDDAMPKPEVSPALKSYLDERGLVPDSPDEWERSEQTEQPDFASMTVKYLRPLASSLGMKGARIATKDELVAFLAQ